MFVNLSNKKDKNIMSFARFVGWTLGAAVGIPLAPLGIVYACVHQVVPSGNGADAWGTFGIFAGGVLGSLALAGLIGIALINPVVAAYVYGGLCLAVGLKMGLMD